MFQNCNKLTSLDISNWDTSKVTDMSGVFGGLQTLELLELTNLNANNATTDNMMDFIYDMNNLKTLILGENSICKSLDNWDDMMNVEQEPTPFPLLEKLICPNADYINKISKYLPDRSSASNSGVIVTNATISDEAMNTISSKNWSIRKMVAQYRYDANTYENLIPEFNTEFSSDKYEIYDSVSEIIIDDIKWEEGSFTNNEGKPVEHANRIRTTNYYTVFPNIEYRFNRRMNVYFYDKTKTFISCSFYPTNNPVLTPTNARYIKFYTDTDTSDGTIEAKDVILSAKLITRSIESKNGDLPSIIKFGLDNETINSTDRELSLKEVIDLNTGNLNTGRRMFAYCRRVEKINSSNWDTSNMTSMYDMFVSCSKLTSLDVSNWDTSNVTNMAYMFSGCTNLTSLDVSNWNTTNATSMASMFFNCYRLTSLDVSNFDTSKVTDMSSLFHNCRKLTTLDVSRWNVDNVTRMDNLFNSCNKLVSLDVSNWNTGNVQNMGCLFGWCNKLTSLDLSNWDTSKVVYMEYMFSECYELTSIGDMSNWDTSKVTNMLYMFQGCNKLTSLDVSNFDTSNVTSMKNMFNNCQNLTTLDVSNWNTGEVTDMYRMFNGCQNLTSLDVSNWDTSKVTTMDGMFYQCYRLTTLDVSKWDTSKVTNFCNSLGMFQYCNCLKNINIGNWDVSKANSIQSMFGMNYNTLNLPPLLEYVDMCNVDLSNINGLGGNFFGGAYNLHTIRCNIAASIYKIAEVVPNRMEKTEGTLISNAKISVETLELLATKNWTVVSDDTLTKVAEYVYDSKIWNSLIPGFNNEFIEYFIDDVEDENGLVTRTISSVEDKLPTMIQFGAELEFYTKYNALLEVLFIDTSNLTTMYNLFRSCRKLISVIGNWNTSKVTNMSCAFDQCYNLTSLDVSNFNTSNVSDMSCMFNNCYKLTPLDVSNFDTSNVTHIQYMFNGCNKLTSLDVSNWDTSKVVNMQGMFYNCNNLTSLDVSNFDTNKVTDMSYIFNNTPLLTDIGMLYCTPSTINMIASVLPTTHTQTIWVQDTKPSECTVVSGVEFKEYKENSVVVNLSSPLLKGDRIEVKDGKLCHYHKMGKVVLDGSEDWVQTTGVAPNSIRFITSNTNNGVKRRTDVFCDTLKGKAFGIESDLEGICQWESGKFSIKINPYRLSAQDVNGFNQWLQAIPTTVVYELTEPYYEDITPLQSNLTLETYLESNLDIYTNLPIKTNLTYSTNIANTSSIEEDINAINEGTDLTNLLEDEINN